MWSLFLGSDVRRFACTKNYQALSISAAEAFQSRETFAFAADSELGFLTKKAICVVGHGSDFTCNTPYVREKKICLSLPTPWFPHLPLSTTTLKEAAAAIGMQSNS